jgi:hypothetical protein
MKYLVITLSLISYIKDYWNNKHIYKGAIFLIKIIKRLEIWRFRHAFKFFK